jgi:excisionase family DNA binding protein
VFTAPRVGADLSATQNWLPVSEAARLIGLSANSVRRFADAGTLPAVRTRLGRLVDPAALERLAARRAAAA